MRLDVRSRYHFSKRRLVIAGRYESPAGRSLPVAQVHRHPAVEIVVATEGRFAVTDGEEWADGSAVVVPWGACRTMRPAADRVTAIAIYLHPATAHARALMRKPEARGGPASWFRLADPVAGLEIPDGISAAAAADLVLAELLGPRGLERREPPTIVEAAMDVLSDRLPAKVSLKELARAIAVSESTLGRGLAREAATTYPVLVRGTRLLYALAEVVDGRNLTDAAHAAGFTDGTHLAKVCREMTGLTPTAVLQALSV